MAMAAQLGAMVQLNDMGLLKSQGLIGGDWTDALDGRSLAVSLSLLSLRFPFQFMPVSAPPVSALSSPSSMTSSFLVH